MELQGRLEKLGNLDTPQSSSATNNLTKVGSPIFTSPSRLPVINSEVWKQWKNPQDALLWARAQLPKMTREELQQEFLALRAVDGKKAPAWVARVNELMRKAVLGN